MSEEIKVILEEIRFKAGIYRDQKRRNEAFNDDDYKCYVLLDYIQQKENIIKEVREKLEYLLNNDTIEINGRTYIKQEADNIITNYIKEILDKGDKGE